MHATAQLSEQSYEPGSSQWTFQKIDSAFQTALAHDATIHATGKRYPQASVTTTTADEKLYRSNPTEDVGYLGGKMTNEAHYRRYFRL